MDIATYDCDIMLFAVVVYRSLTVVNPSLLAPTFPVQSPSGYRNNASSWCHLYVVLFLSAKRVCGCAGGRHSHKVSSLQHTAQQLEPRLDHHDDTTSAAPVSMRPVCVIAGLSPEVSFDQGWSARCVPPLALRSMQILKCLMSDQFFVVQG